MKKYLYPDFLVKIINEKLNIYIKDYKTSPEILRKAISYSLKNGGKRFRPVLCLAVAGSLGCRYEDVAPTACAIELIHTYSLIHDDLPSIDNDDLRRGKPTCHKIFGEDIAILAGDALFAEAFNIILKYQQSESEKIIEALAEIGQASGALGMVAGQTVDVFYTGKEITRRKLMCMHKNKTGKLIIAAVRCGAILCNASQGHMNKFTRYAENIGMAFQITDDILDVVSSSEDIGKTAGKDSLQNKNTFPSMFGMEKSRKIAEKKVSEAINIVKSMEINSEWLIKIANFLLLRKS
ncbi:MAG: polyprenyl synthetase family protein [Actinobacteria bacterium]|nr:polyprenyl synthetase family protein [Actinomycetota bacterium]MBU4450798.1 polyprenyl synthetase family protein [Actinomycetota bacterium]MCG2789007.1 polyprenyl synthetase family protein [Actinomycetes bacterium]